MRETVNTHEKQDNIYIRWYSFLARFHKPQQNCWRVLENEYGWYWYYSIEEGKRGYIIANDKYETQPIDGITLDEFMGYRERFAEKELEEMGKE